MINRHYRTQIRGIRETVDGVFDGEGNRQIVETKKKRVGKRTPCTIKHMATEFSDIRQTLKAIIPATGDHGGAIPVPIGYTNPGKSTDRRLMDAIVTDR